MVQGNLKRKPQGKPQKAHNAAKLVKAAANAKKVKKGSAVKLPKKHFRDHALDDRELSKAIDKANEQKVAAKLLQGGGKIATKDILQRGKELNREQRRSQVKKKLSRVEEKLRDLKQKADADGLI